jgi:hypothetical protein
MPRARPQGPQLEERRGKWYILWWDGNDRRRISTGTDDAVRARQALADFEASLARGPDHLTVEDALKRYEISRRGKVEAFQRLCDASSVLSEKMGSLRLEQINQTQWDRYAAGRIVRPRPNEKRKASRPVSTSTLRREFNVLRAALRLAWKEGFLTKPPAMEPPRETAPRAIVT